MGGGDDEAARVMADASSEVPRVPVVPSAGVRPAVHAVPLVSVPRPVPGRALAVPGGLVSGALLVALAAPSAAGAGSAAVPPLPVPGARAAPLPRRGARAPPSAVARTGPSMLSAA